MSIKLPPRCSDRYVLVRQAGAGGSSTVWLAHAGDSARPVALKVARERSFAPALAAEALHAALALSPRLPDLVDVGLLAIDGSVGHRVELGSDGTLPFIALGWVDGDSIEAQVRTGACAPDLALRVARDAGEALGDMHAVGLAHGDVKPANLVLGGDGRISLLDLGLACDAGSTEVAGGTVRYLPQDPRELGDARARDLLALGLVLAELACPEVARSSRPIGAARRATVPEPLAAICGALLTPEPGARPSARWVCETAAELLHGARSPREDLAAATAGRSRRQVRAAYLRLRRGEIAGATGAAPEVAPWLAPAIDVAVRARAMAATGGSAPQARDEPRPDSLLGPLDPEGRIRWLISLVGPSATAWPSDAVLGASETDLAHALDLLASRRRPALWSVRDVEAALAGGGAPPPKRTAPARERLGRGKLDAAAAASLALRLGRVPLDAEAVETVELLGDRAPAELCLAAADALRLAGELGRARSLVLRRPEGGAVRADILRRAGDLAQAAELARRCVEEGTDAEGRALACLARILLDGGRVDEAAPLVREPGTAAVAEVAALVAAACGERDLALRHVRRGLALATGAEARARLYGAMAYIEKQSDPASARQHVRAAVEHAARAGAVLEEASYTTAEAAACVDLGEIAAAIDAGRRAALLWEEGLGRRPMAARGWLACAAAYAAVGARHEAAQTAERAAARAAEGHDALGEACALWCLADASEAGEPAARAAAVRAALLVADGSPGEGLHAAARLLRHAPAEIDGAARARRDAMAVAGSSAGAPVEPRLAWWEARADALCRADLDGTATADARRVLGELAALCDPAAPVVAKGKAMYAGGELAARVGDGELRSRLEAERARLARQVVAGAPSSLAAAARACRWLAQRGTSAERIEPEQAMDLQQLVRALGERRSLRALLDRVLDVLLLWTGAERGLLLRLSAEGALVPRAARNLARADLVGEQLAVSTSLAQRALERGTPVVAVDAMQELGSSFQSVHALRLRSVLAVPLRAGGQAVGVVYLDDRVRAGAFGERQVAWAQSVAHVAALAIAGASAQAELRRALRRAELAGRRLERALAHKETALDLAERELARATSARSTRFAYDEIVGESAAVRALFGVVDRVSCSDIPVLLRGESGSGKELVARAIHRHSARGSRPFVAENCAALPETLLESALFGHVRGAFTGADRPRLGLFEAAHGGTLFLDEIGDMSLGMQTKLLRVIEDGLVRPIGTESARHVDVRIIAATHRDLEQMVAGRSFREDLYYRLNVVCLDIPPLRERSGDVPLLVRHFVDKHSTRGRIDVSAGAMERLAHCGWPGNVRQLENEIRRALLLCEQVIDTRHLSIPDEGPPPPDFGLNVHARLDQLEGELVRQAIEQTAGNQSKAAELLGVSRHGLHKMLRRLGMARPERRR